ncbi:hypothetical protein HPB48_000104 [Haemaphysalis longicornis]|uniref:C2H2-type domain-containing protein n=1 Tax=Haemaphysalis longicornis TaxID=44386 RepID=A0A9J6GNR4_HAELO|nr:hypothetical protein HPB48_000104 [Haemaphysalis longicornis]
MGDHTKPAAGASEDPGIPPNVCRNGWHVPIPADNAEHLECAVDPNEMLIGKVNMFRQAESLMAWETLKHLTKYMQYYTYLQSNYNRHTLAHVEEKRHTCDECQKTFRRLEHLVMHKVTHTKEKKFQCPTCSQSFNRRSNLARHEMSKHRGDKTRLNACELCGRCFVRADNLARHQLVHTRERRFSCEKCPKRFGHLSALKRHVMKFHALEPSP